MFNDTPYNKNSGALFVHKFIYIVHRCQEELKGSLDMPRGQKFESSKIVNNTFYLQNIYFIQKFKFFFFLFIFNSHGPVHRLEH